MFITFVLFCYILIWISFKIHIFLNINMHRKFSSVLIEKSQKLNQSDAYNSFVGQLPLLVSSLSLYYGIKSQVSSEIKTSDQHHQELLKSRDQHQEELLKSRDQHQEELLKIALEQLKTREKHQEELLKSRDQHHEELLKIIREDMKSSELRQEELLKSSELRQEKLLEVLTQRLDSTEKRVDYFMSGYRSVKQSEINSSN